MANRIDLDGRSAVVTGGAQGIGRGRLDAVPAAASGAIKCRVVISGAGSAAYAHEYVHGELR
jgi:hypothetical protein